MIYFRSGHKKEGPKPLPSLSIFPPPSPLYLRLQGLKIIHGVPCVKSVCPPLAESKQDDNQEDDEPYSAAVLAVH